MHASVVLPSIHPYIHPSFHSSGNNLCCLCVSPRHRLSERRYIIVIIIVNIITTTIITIFTFVISTGQLIESCWRRSNLNFSFSCTVRKATFFCSAIIRNITTLRSLNGTYRTMFAESNCAVINRRRFFLPENTEQKEDAFEVELR